MSKITIAVFGVALLLAGCPLITGPGPGSGLPYVLIDGSGLTTYTFSGSNGLSEIPTGNQITPGLALDAGDRVALDWDSSGLYLAVATVMFSDQTKAYVLYLETTQSSFSAAVSNTGIEYASLTAEVPFDAQYAIAIRGTVDDVEGGSAWTGLYERKVGGWELVAAFVDDDSMWRTTGEIDVVVPFSLIGTPTSIRIAGHAINEVVTQEWKDVIPTGHTPWATSTSGFYEIDLSGTHTVSSWTKI